MLLTGLKFHRQMLKQTWCLMTEQAQLLLKSGLLLMAVLLSFSQKSQVLACDQMLGSTSRRNC